MQKHKFRERTSVVVVKDKKILGFHAVDPTSQKKYFFLPGGGIEDGESLQEAAIRETLEETGYKISLVQPPTTKQYDFEWNGAIYDCKTHFFKGKIIKFEKEVTNEPTYHKGVDWVPVDKVVNYFSYSPEILDAVKGLI